MSVDAEVPASSHTCHGILGGLRNNAGCQQNEILKTAPVEWKICYEISAYDCPNRSICRINLKPACIDRDALCGLANLHLEVEHGALSDVERNRSAGRCTKSLSLHENFVQARIETGHDISPASICLDLSFCTGSLIHDANQGLGYYSSGGIGDLALKLSVLGESGRTQTEDEN
ncbi:hypothetical protein GCM10011586_13780 [Silvibacterium dinghuense]|nr:hypothetical protein GCM10011586_13780 [Silvibacterium dinghuense]